MAFYFISKKQSLDLGEKKKRKEKNQKKSKNQKIKINKIKY